MKATLCPLNYLLSSIGECVDKQETSKCKGWARQGLCTSPREWRAYMEENCGKTCRFCESSGESPCVSISIGVGGDVWGQGGGANPKTTPTIPSRLVGFAVSLSRTESIRKSSNINFSWAKIEYQNNLNPIVLFSTLFKS